LLGVWSLRRVLLVGESSGMLSAMHAQLTAVGARPHVALPDEEFLFRVLHEGRYSCVIVPSVLHLCAGDADARFAALDTLLLETREAGVPLAMLLSRHCAQPNDEAACLFSHALGWARGAFGDPVNVQCIQYRHADLRHASRDALARGARFLAGERTCAGLFSI